MLANPLRNIGLRGIAHCRKEKSEENTRLRSSQVVGDDTAHIVRIRFIAFMRISLFQWLKNYVAGRAKFPKNVRNSEVDAEHQPRLVALEIDEIKGAA
jgi:hypothetical protein